MAEKPTFGDDFYKWVLNESSQVSLDFTEANYAQRLQNYFALYYDFQFRKLQSINDELSELTSLYNSLESELSELQNNDENNNLIKWIRRSETSSGIMYRLVEIRNDFKQINSKLLDAKLLWSKKKFNEEGLFHISYETFLESFMKLGSEYSTKLNQSYGVTVSFSTDTSDSDASVAPEVHYEEGAMLLTVVQAAASKSWISGPWAIVVTMIIVAFEIWKMEEERKEFEKEVKKQQKKYAEAIKLLGSKIPNPDRRYDIYENVLNEIWNRDDIKEVNESYKTLNSNLEKLWNSLFKAVTSQKFLSDNYLTVAKVEYVKERYLSDNIIRRVFNQLSSFDLLQILQENWNYLLTQRSNIGSLTSKSLEWVKSIESYYDNLYTLLLFLRDLNSKSSSIPFAGMIPKKIEFITNELNHLRADNSFLTHLEFMEDEIKASDIKNNTTLVEEIAATDKQFEYSEFRKSKKALFSYENHSVIEVPLFWVNIKVGSGFGITNSFNDFSYRSRFGNNYDNFNDNVMYSPYDGGYSIDNRRVTSEVNQNIKNIRQRTEFLQSDFQGLEQTMKEWVSSNRNSLESINSNSNIIESQVSISLTEFQSINVDNLKPLMDSMDDILDNIDTSSSLSQRLRNSGIESSTLSFLPSHMANPNNNILNSYGYTQRHYPTSQNQADLKLEFLKKKKDNYQEITRARVEENHSHNRLDPIMGNQNNWNDYLQRSKAYWKYASAFSTINNDESNWDHIQINNLKNFYLEKSEELMYSAIGAIEQTEPSEFNFISSESANYVRDQLKDTLSDYFDGNLPDPPEGLENTACNIFVANALLEVYGVPDLVNLQINHGDFYAANWLANDIIKEIDKSENWSKLGIATAQSDIDNAAYYASIGFPVVAVRPGNVHGHIALISPGYADFQSTTWADRANNPNYSHIPYSLYKNLRLPRMINYSLNASQYSGFNIPFSTVYSNPQGVIFYVRKP